MKYEYISTNKYPTWEITHGEDSIELHMQAKLPLHKIKKLIEIVKETNNLTDDNLIPTLKLIKERDDRNLVDEVAWQV